ncbi:hypothetical protein [Nocardioides sp.]|uniref:hypothetical protein n=1 Tax=Nocardioides sp. TaxID=35761 RepID=UPI00261E6DAD|nr:hypothetical protein [Nocardioides sp.]MDI6911624.1 hypothetical protein [Nocardioides sp.]
MVRARGSSVATAVVGLVVLVSVAGCANSQDGEVRRVADSFYAAVGSHDGGAACDALAPGTVQELEESAEAPCREAILSEDLPGAGAVGSVHVFGTTAQVRYGDDTAFLSRFQFGWRVMAAACRPQPHGPYDCQVKGG